MSTTITPEQLADRVGVYPVTVRRWCAKGIIQAGRIGPRGPWRIPLGEADRVAAAAAGKAVLP